MSLNSEKKEYMVKKQKYLIMVKRNRKIGTASMVFLFIGLILKAFERPDLGGQFIWLGIILVIYVMGSNWMGRRDLNKLE
ncbi:MAG: hypothetical protein ACXQTE_00885 [Methanosarcinaceae archaeon]